MPVALTNASTVVSDAAIEAMIPALQQQVNTDLYNSWRVKANLVFVSKGQAVPAGSWVMTLMDNSDVGAGVLGYHETDAAGLPTAKVFAKDTAAYGGIVSSVVSHELLEMLVDPQGALSYFVQDSATAGRVIPCEVCDPTEGTYYSINGVQVSDFITPYWASAAHPAGRVFDHLGRLNNTLQIASGGYMSYLSVGVNGQWQQVFADGRIVPATDPDDKGVAVARPRRVCHHAARP